MNNHHWIFLSPHLDDVTLSCGALVWDLVRQGHRVEIWTLMTGLPPDEDFSPFAQQLHETWGISGTEAILARCAEDRAAGAILGAELRHFDWPDAIYRRDTLTGETIVNNDDQLFSRAPEPTLVNEIVEMISSSLPEAAHLVFPIGLGGHIDHQAVVRAGAALAREKTYYADYPYIVKDFHDPRLWDGCLKKIPRAFSPAALDAWQAAVLCYTSQLSTFWRDEDEARLAISNYLAGGGGCLWTESRLDSQSAQR